MIQFDEKGKWYKGNLHTHTTASDGQYTPEETMNLYRRLGYDFLALTDHWILSKGGWYDNMLLLPGIVREETRSLVSLASTRSSNPSGMTRA